MKRASGSLVEALGCFFLASSLGRGSWRAPCAPPRAVRAPPALLPRAPEPRAPHGLAPLGPDGSRPQDRCQLLLEGGQPLGDRGFDLDEFFARPERFLLALARIFVPSTAISARRTALRRSAPSRFASAAGRGSPPARPGNQRARDNSAARRPPATDRRRRFGRAVPVRAPNPPLRPSHRATAKAEPRDRRPAGPLRPRAREPAREPDRKAAKDRGSRRNSRRGARDAPLAKAPRDRSYPSAADAGPAAPPELPPSPIHLTEPATENHSPSESANSFTRCRGNDTLWSNAVT